MTGGEAAEGPREPAEAARSLAAIRREAVFTATMSGLTDPFVIPYALALGATSFHAGLLSSLRNLLISLVQLKAVDAVRLLGSRRKLVLWCVGIQAALWLPLAFVGPLFGTGAVEGLILLFTLASASAALTVPAWGSLVAEYLPDPDRGRMLGGLARLVGLQTTFSGLIAGGLLQLMQRRPLVAFAMLCLAAAVSRSLAWRAIARLHEEPWQDSPALRFSFWKFIRQVRRSNFARFSLCLGGLSFATHMAAPFFAVYMLQELHYGYLLYTTIILSGSVTGSLASAWWGRTADRLGSQAILRWTCVGVSALPALWLLSGDGRWVMAMNVFGAFLWSGLNLCTVNFLYDAVSAPKRHTCLAYFNVVHGLGVSAGAFVGGWLVDALPPSPWFSTRRRPSGWRRRSPSGASCGRYARSVASTSARSSSTSSGSGSSRSSAP